MEQQAKELLYSGRFEDGWTVLRQHIEDRRLKEQTTQSWEAEVRLMALLVMQCPFVVSAEDLLNHLRLMFNDNNGMMMANTVADDGQPWTVNMPSHLLLQLYVF
jgi:hypothetical protein